MEAQAKILGPVHEKIVYTSYVIKVLTGKDQASMHIRTVSLEPSLIAL